MNLKSTITERLAGSIKLDDEGLIDEIVESEDWVGGSDDPDLESYLSEQ